MLIHRKHIQDLSENKAGTLKIGTSPIRSAAMMPAIAKYFRSIYPGMHLVIDEMESGELLESCAHGDFDFCLTVLPKDGTGFDYQTITREEMVLAIPAHMQQPNAPPWLAANMTPSMPGNSTACPL